jgi:hypothetical protein
LIAFHVRSGIPIALSRLAWFREKKQTFYFIRKMRLYGLQLWPLYLALWAAAQITPTSTVSDPHWNPTNSSQWGIFAGCAVSWNEISEGDFNIGSMLRCLTWEKDKIYTDSMQQMLKVVLIPKYSAIYAQISRPTSTAVAQPSLRETACQEELYGAL